MRDPACGQRHEGLNSIAWSMKTNGFRPLSVRTAARKAGPAGSSRLVQVTSPAVAVEKLMLSPTLLIQSVGIRAPKWPGFLVESA